MSFFAFRFSFMNGHSLAGLARQKSANNGHSITPIGAAEHLRFRGTDVTEYLAGSCGSLCLDVEGPDHVAPLLRFVGDELAEIGWRTLKDRCAQGGKSRLDLGISEGGIDFPC
jgi:hypothetical protein